LIKIRGKSKRQSNIPDYIDDPSCCNYNDKNDPLPGSHSAIDGRKKAFFSFNKIRNHPDQRNNYNNIERNGKQMKVNGINKPTMKDLY
jgi:hypothetical protein